MSAERKRPSLSELGIQTQALVVSFTSTRKGQLKHTWCIKGKLEKRFLSKLKVSTSQIIRLESSKLTLVRIASLSY